MNIELAKEHFNRLGFLIRIDKDVRYVIVTLIKYEIYIDLW